MNSKYKNIDKASNAMYVIHYVDNIFSTVVPLHEKAIDYLLQKD